MPYATRADLEALYGVEEIAQRESMLPMDAVERALTDAGAEVDSYLSGRYTLPLAPVPDNIRRHACVMARYYLLGDAATERARNDYRDAVAYLRDVQAGRAVIAGVAAPTGASQAATVQLTNGRDRAFGGGL